MVAVLTFTSDGVDEDHVDADPDNPEHFTETYEYTLSTDANGLITGGSWADNNEHPDFAWVPYHNPTTSSNGSAENPFLQYGTFVDLVVDLDRR